MLATGTGSSDRPTWPDYAEARGRNLKFQHRTERDVDTENRCLSADVLWSIAGETERGRPHHAMILSRLVNLSSTRAVKPGAVNLPS